MNDLRTFKAGGKRVSSGGGGMGVVEDAVWNEESIRPSPSVLRLNPRRGTRGVLLRLWRDMNMGFTLSIVR